MEGTGGRIWKDKKSIDISDDRSERGETQTRVRRGQGGPSNTHRGFKRKRSIWNLTQDEQIPIKL